MAKELKKLRIVIEGDESAPSSMYYDYVVAESTDNTLEKGGGEQVASPSYNKTFHNAGSVGEMWRDCVDSAKTKEGI